MLKKYFFLFSIIIISCIYLLQPLKKIENFENYTKCSQKKIQPYLKDVFDNINLHRVKNNKKWDLFLPCGYNNVENELSQLSNLHKNKTIFAIDNCGQISKKDTLWKNICNKYGRKRAKNIMPNTFILDDNKDMNLFKKTYIKNHIYFLKSNIQRKKGIKLTKNLSEILNAKKEINNFKLVQESIPNLYLINGRKVNLRIYVLVVCQFDKICCYLHQNGKCLYTNRKFKNNMMNLENLITSLNMNKDIYNTHPLTLDDLKRFMGNKKYKQLWKNISKKVTLVFNSVIDKICVNKNIYKNVKFQLFGGDVIFNNKLDSFILEFNKGPNMYSQNDKDYQLKKNVLLNVFEIVGYKNKNISKQRFDLIIKKEK